MLLSLLLHSVDRDIDIVDDDDTRPWSVFAQLELSPPLLCSSPHLTIHDDKIQKRRRTGNPPTNHPHNLSFPIRPGKQTATNPNTPRCLVSTLFRLSSIARPGTPATRSRVCFSCARFRLVDSSLLQLSSALLFNSTLGGMHPIACSAAQLSFMSVVGCPLLPIVLPSPQARLLQLQLQSIKRKENAKRKIATGKQLKP